MSFLEVAERKQLRIENTAGTPLTPTRKRKPVGRQKRGPDSDTVGPPGLFLTAAQRLEVAGGVLSHAAGHGVDDHCRPPPLFPPLAGKDGGNEHRGVGRV